jgi:hypothetical protein
MAGKLVYAFYSSCQDKSYRFQFIYKKSTINISDTDVTVYDYFNKDSERIITDKQCQYYIDGISE